MGSSGTRVSSVNSRFPKHSQINDRLHGRSSYAERLPDAVEIAVGRRATR